MSESLDLSDLRVVHGNATAEEAAAAIAALHAALYEEASHGFADDVAPSAWAQQTRSPRATLEPRFGWTGFTGA